MNEDVDGITDSRIKTEGDIVTTCSIQQLSRPLGGADSSADVVQKFLFKSTNGLWRSPGLERNVVFGRAI
jgi:hypothetical protein